jgi:hypothetical protein
VQDKAATVAVTSSQPTSVSNNQSGDFLRPHPSKPAMQPNHPKHAKHPDVSTDESDAMETVSNIKRGRTKIAHRISTSSASESERDEGKRIRSGRRVSLINK